MTKSDKKDDVSRRDFMTGAGKTATIAGAAVLAGGAAATAATDDDRGKSTGYRETGHIRTYYDLAKF